MTPDPQLAADLALVQELIDTAAFIIAIAGTSASSERHRRAATALTSRLDEVTRIEQERSRFWQALDEIRYLPMLPNEPTAKRMREIAYSALTSTPAPDRSQQP